MERVKLLGKPSIQIGDNRQPIPKGKTGAVIIYLAYQEDWVSREDLTYLLWPDSTDKQAKGNLRSLLSRNITKLDYVDLEIQAEFVRWSVDSDVRLLKDAFKAGIPKKVVEIYNGNFLEDYYLADVPEFEHWLNLEREELWHQFKEQAQLLENSFMSQGKYQEGLEVLKKVLDYDPFDEQTFRRYLNTTFLAKGQSQAQTELQRYQKYLVEELGSEPEQATIKLLEDLMSLKEVSDLDRKSVRNSASQIEDKPKHNLPIKPTALVGRSAERDALAKLIADPAIKLLTIVAHGGMGKTRLAISVAEEHIGSFADGVWFIPFETLENPDNIVFQLAEGLNFKFFGQENNKTQLFNYLQNKEMLLVTDNLEHLLEGVVILGELVEYASAIKILTTSREILNLQAEHIFELSGLGLDDTTTQESEAVRLFVQRTQQRDKTFRLNDENKIHVETICESVAGMPLALELAASWLRALSLEEIVEELQKSIDILESQSRDRSKRQQSIRTIFDYSWSLLNEQEKYAIAKLTVFHGGFNRHAAKEVCKVSIPVLLGLCNKSFLTKDSKGRYTQHPLMWQYNRGKYFELADNTIISNNHRNYFMYFLGEMPLFNCTLETRPLLDAINLDFVNIMIAWDLAVEQRQEVLFENAIFNLESFLLYESRLADGKRIFQKAINNFDDKSLVYARLNLALGELEGHSGANVIPRLLECVELLEQHGDDHFVARALFFMSVNYDVIGKHEKATEVLKRCRTLSEKTNDDLYLGWSTSHLAIKPNLTVAEKFSMHQKAIAILRGCNGYFPLSWAHMLFATFLCMEKGTSNEALEHIEEGIRIESHRGWQSRLANFYVHKANICIALGLLQEAEDSAHAVLAMTKGLEFGFLLRAIDRSYFVLGKAAKLRGDYESANSKLLLALELLNKREHLRSSTRDYIFTICELAKIALLEKKLEVARSYLSKALEKTWEPKSTRHHLYTLQAEIAIADKDSLNARHHLAQAFKDQEHLPAILDLFVIYADVLELEGNSSQAASILKCVVEHPATHFESKQCAKVKMDDLAIPEREALEFETIVDLLKSS